MARPLKQGLEYFSFDVDIFEDDKIFDIQNEYGPLGEVIYLRLLCLIYKNGYYYRFDTLDKLASMIIKSIGNRWARDKQVVKQVILSIVKCNLLSSELMQENVLTSASIQKRYQKVTGRRQSMNTEYLIVGNGITDGLINAHKNQENINDNRINVYNNSVNDSNNVYKEKKSKANKSKVKESKETPTFASPSLLEIETFCKEEKILVNAKVFFNYYNTNDWFVGINKMKDWKASLRLWEEREKEKNSGKERKGSFEISELETLINNEKLI